MKLCFSTLACPRWSFDDVVNTAKDFGYDAVEIRGIADKIYAPDILAFSNSNIEKTKKRLETLGLEIACLTSGATIADETKYSEAMAEAKLYIDLAEKLGVPYVRVMSTGTPDFSDGSADLTAVGYTELCRYADGKGVTPLLETNGVLCDTALLARIMEYVPSENKGVLWDVHHPYRFNGESPETTLANIGKYVKHVHLKDSVSENGEIHYKIMGYGDLPLKKIIKLLNESGYDGALSLEWVKRWDKTLEEPGIVLMNYVHYMQEL